MTKGTVPLSHYKCELSTKQGDAGDVYPADEAERNDKKCDKGTVPLSHFEDSFQIQTTAEDRKGAPDGEIDLSV